MRVNLSNGAFCAFITKDESLIPVMENLGYNLIASAQVPQRDFVLPSSKKKKQNKDDRTGSSDCVLTIVQYNTKE